MPCRYDWTVVFPLESGWTEINEFDSSISHSSNRFPEKSKEQKSKKWNHGLKWLDWSLKLGNSSC